jgi:hypothetical protein
MAVNSQSSLSRGLWPRAHKTLGGYLRQAVCNHPVAGVKRGAVHEA